MSNIMDKQTFEAYISKHSFGIVWKWSALGYSYVGRVSDERAANILYQKYLKEAQSNG